MPPGPQISFCTSCFNRAYQLKQVFIANAEAVAANRNVEWVILNYASEDDLHEFMMAQLPGCSRRIVYARETAPRPWHASIAKNMAHRLGAGDYLMNLDADNFIGNSAEVIALGAADGAKMLHLRSTRIGDGTYGRIVMARDVFHRLGGYDESFLPMGFQDADLVLRALASGWGNPAWAYPAPPDSAIRNTKAESIRHCGEHGMTFKKMNERNQAHSRRNLEARRYVANEEAGWTPMSPIVTRGWIRDAAPSADRRGRGRKRAAAAPKR